MWRASVLTIFPDMFPGPLGVSLAGKALHFRHLVARRARHPRRGHRQAPHRRRHPGRRRPRHGDEGRRARPRARRPAPRHPTAPLDEPARRPLTQAPRGGTRPWPRRRDPVRPLRGRGRAADQGPPAGRGLARRFRSIRRRNPGAGPAGRLRAAAAGRHGQGGLGRRGKLRRRPARISAISPGPPCSRASRSPRSWCRATTPRSPPGAGPRPSASRASGGPTCGRPTPPASRPVRTNRP